MKAKWPTFGAYLVLHNAESNGYPWRECIRTALEYCDTVYILEVDSSPEDVAAIHEEFSYESRIVMKRLEDQWDMDDMTIVGRMKQQAREMVKEEYCIYLDADEILKIANREILTDLVLNNSHSDVFSLPYVTFFGDPYHIANFKDMENFWRWKIFRNLSHIGHGVHGKARQYDGDGKLYMDKKVSDGCELINMNTLDVMGSVLFMPQQYIQAGNIYGTVPETEDEKAIVSIATSEVVNQFPMVCLHYGWIDFKRKAQNAINYWTKTKAYKTGVEHSRMFDGLNPESINGFEGQEQQILNTISGWQKIDRISLNIKAHPDIIQPKIAHLLKPKVLTISLSNRGPHGVPKWNHALVDALTEYDVQNFAFDDHVATAPASSNEIQKAQSFTHWLEQSESDYHASVIFADGFWAATYKGNAKVVSVIHGLWSHPLRDKWDDGLIEQRKQLFEYQIEYYNRAESMGHTLICVSPFIHKILKEDYGIDSVLIPNAVDLDFWDSIRITNLEKDKPLILHGITSVNKGSDIIHAIERHPLIKDRFDIGSIDEISKHAGVPKAVAFKAADVAFLPTKWEASSYLLLECLANNLPIAAHRAGILNCTDMEHIDNIGVIVDDYDVDAFAKAIVKAHEDRLKHLHGRMFLQANGMTLDKWGSDIKQLIYKVL